MINWKRVIAFTAQIVFLSVAGTLLLIFVLYKDKGVDVLRFEMQVSAFISTVVSSVVGFYFALQRDRLQDALRRLGEMVDRDVLTGLASRACFFRFVGPRIEPVAKGKTMPALTVSALLLIDADHFKAINDQNGHQIGDEVLVEMGSRLRVMTRRGEIAARLGGEEFALFLPEITPSEALARAEAIRRLMAQRPINTFNETSVRATVSIGVAFHEPGQSLVTLISAADRALYAAKAAGRNRVITAPSDWLPPPAPLPEPATAPRAA
jgi:diguanylate cyclase (GGDEF)-like protein